MFNFIFHISCLETLQTSCCGYINASMSFTFADRIIWCSQWEFSLFQGSSSFESCFCYNIWFSNLLFWSLQTCVNSSLIVIGMLSHHTWVTQMGEKGWNAWVICHIRKVVWSCPLQWRNMAGWGKMCFCKLYLVPSGLVMPVNHLLR